MAGYIIALHLLSIVLVAKTDFVPKLKVKFGMSAVLDPNPHFQRMVTYHRWMDELVPENSVVFLGDSITQGLATAAVAPYTINYGIGGEDATQLLEAIPSYRSLTRASAVVLAIGINDLGHGKKEGLKDRYRRIADAIPLEKTLIWSSVMPAKSAKISSADIVETNRTIKTMCEERRNCIFVDTWSFLADANGLMISRYFLDDGVHLTPDGYRQWISALKQAMYHVPATQMQRDSPPVKGPLSQYVGREE